MEFVSILIPASFHMRASFKLEKEEGGIIILVIEHFRTAWKVFYVSQTGITLNNKNLMVELK